MLGNRTVIVKQHERTENRTHQEALKLWVSKGDFKPRAPRYPIPLVGAHLPLLLLPVLPASSPLVPALANASSRCRLGRVCITSTESWPLPAALSTGLFATRHYSFSGAGRAWAADPASGFVDLVAGQGAVGRGAPGTAVLGRFFSADAACFPLDLPHP